VQILTAGLVTSRKPIVNNKMDLDPGAGFAGDILLLASGRPEGCH